MPIGGIHGSSDLQSQIISMKKVKINSQQDCKKFTLKKFLKFLASFRKP